MFDDILTSVSVPPTILAVLLTPHLQDGNAVVGGPADAVSSAKVYYTKVLEIKNVNLS